MKRVLRCALGIVGLALGFIPFSTSGAATSQTYHEVYAATIPHIICGGFREPGLLTNFTVGGGCHFLLQGVGSQATVDIDDTSDHPVGATYIFWNSNFVVLASGHVCGSGSLVVPQGAVQFRIAPATIEDGDACGAGTVGTITIVFP
jgi:hypothetical protein